MGPQNPVVPTAVETTSYTPEQTVDVASSRFATPGKTARIGQTQTLTDMARFDPMAGVIDPATNVTGFLDQPSDLGSMAEGIAAQRGAPTGLLSADAQTTAGRAEYALQKALEDQQIAQPTVDVPTQQAGLLSNPALAAPNFAQAVNPTVPSLSVPTVQAGLLGQPSVAAPTAAPQITPSASQAQQLAGYQQMAATASPAGLLNLSGTNLQDINLSGNVVPTAAYTPTNTLEDLQTVEVAEQPTVAGPATPEVDPEQEQEQAPTTTTAARSIVKTAPATKPQQSFADKMKAAVNPGTAIGAAIGGGLLGIPGALGGGYLGNKIAQGGFLNDPMSINPIGGGSANVYSVWGGGQPAGTQATASDGQTVTAMPNGYTAVTGKSGVVTVFDGSGKPMSYFGGALGQDQEAEAEASTSSGGGFFGGLFG